MIASLRTTLAALLWLGASAAGAAPICTIATIPVAFGGYSALSGNARDSVGSIGVNCSGETPGSVSYSIALSPGTGTYTSRVLMSGAYSLGYNLFLDSARSLVWGDGTGGSSTVSDSYTLAVSPTLRSYPVYGRIPGGQRHAHVGSYGDSIIVTVSF